MTLHDLITLVILPIGTSGTNGIQYMKYTSEYIPKLQIHQHFRVISLMLIINRPFWPHFGFQLGTYERSNHISSQRQLPPFQQLYYSLFYFRHLIEYVFTISLLSLQNVCDYDFVYVLSFRSCINLDQLVQIQKPHLLKWLNFCLTSTLM